jgi:hypothetical protein
MTEEEINKTFDEEYIKYRDAFPKDYDIPALAQPAPVQEPVALTYKEVADAMNALWGGTLEQVNIAMEMADKKLYTTPPQRTWVGLDWLPEHKCGLHLSHNEHRDVYEKIEEFYDSEDFISPEEWRKAVAEDSVWVLHWYPNTPIGFIRIAASTLEAIKAYLKEKNNV